MTKGPALAMMPGGAFVRAGSGLDLRWSVEVGQENWLVIPDLGQRRPEDE